MSIWASTSTCDRHPALFVSWSGLVGDDTLDETQFEALNVIDVENVAGAEVVQRAP